MFQDIRQENSIYKYVYIYLYKYIYVYISCRQPANILNLDIVYSPTPFTLKVSIL